MAPMRNLYMILQGLTFISIQSMAFASCNPQIDPTLININSMHKYDLDLPKSDRFQAAVAFINHCSPVEKDALSVPACYNQCSLDETCLAVAFDTNSNCLHYVWSDEIVNNQFHNTVFFKLDILRIYFNFRLYSGGRDLVCANLEPIAYLTQSTYLIHGIHFSANLSCLAGQAAWVAEVNDRNPWIQADFGTNRRIFSLVMKGWYGSSHWITRFTISYKISNAVEWSDVRDTNGADRIFVGNSNPDIPVQHDFLPIGLVASSIRINVRSFSLRPCIRWSLLGY